MLVIGPASPALGRRIKKETEIDSVEVKSKIFPDGEIYVKLDGDVSGKHCTIVQTTYPNRHLIELFFIQDALIENGARSIKVIVPYYSYSRQDKRFEKGEAISARAIAEHISLHSDAFYSVDLHATGILDYFKIPSHNLSSMPLLAEHSELYDPDLLLSPDEGGKDRIRMAAEDIDKPWDYLEKTRIDGKTVEVKPKRMDVEGMTVVILDDIISTGGTMIEAASKLYEMGADEVHAGCTHGLFVGDSLERLKKSFDSFFCTDTIECEQSEVSVAPLLKEKILG